MIDRIKYYLASAVHYLGDAAHKRFVAAVIVILANHRIGHTLNADMISNALDIIIGGLAGAWSKNTPKIEEVK